MVVTMRAVRLAYPVFDFKFFETCGTLFLPSCWAWCVLRDRTAIKAMARFILRMAAVTMTIAVIRAKHHRLRCQSLIPNDCVNNRLRAVLNLSRRLFNYTGLHDTMSPIFYVSLNKIMI